jgi:hypothetical protein
MMISRVFRFRRRIVTALVLPLFLWSVDATAFAARPADEEIRVTIKAVDVKPDLIVISYELIGAESESYEVSFVLLKEGSSAFRVPVRSASGDLGKGQFSGGTRQVRWEYKRDSPANLEGDGFYFEITVTRVSRSNLLLYVGLGALAIGGGVAILAAKKGGGEAPSPTELPLPPARPAQ